MCYRALTCNVEILVWLYILILWKRKENKDLLQFDLPKRKSLQVPLWCFSHALDPFGFRAWQCNYIYIVVLNIINGNFGFVKSWQKGSKPIGASVLFVPFWSHSKPHTKAQLEWPERLVQLDNQLYLRRETYKIL